MEVGQLGVGVPTAQLRVFCLQVCLQATALPIVRTPLSNIALDTGPPPFVVTDALKVVIVLASVNDFHATVTVIRLTIR